jgi:serine/threonine protein kinase/CHASE2 domain-containing sensor protein
MVSPSNHLPHARLRLSTQDALQFELADGVGGVLCLWGDGCYNCRNSKGMSEIKAGETIAGRYEVLGELSRGGMGALYRVRHLLTGRTEALKIILVDRGFDESYIRRFMVEVKAVAQLKSPNTVTLFDCGHTEDDRLYYTMELLDGAPLDELLARQGRLQWPRALRFCTQVCESLEEAHGAGILHRDLKPGNLFAVRAPDGTDSVKVLDFGIARLLDEPSSLANTMAGAVVGTPFYMSPEQARGQVLDFRSDIYSMGVVLYELITGRRPFTASTRSELESKLFNELPPAFAEVCPGLDFPDELEELVQSCLAKDPEKRPDSAPALRRALLDVLSEYDHGVMSEVSPVSPSSGLETTADSHASGASQRVLSDFSTVASHPVEGLPPIAEAGGGREPRRQPMRRRWKAIVAMSAALALALLAPFLSPVKRLNEVADTWRQSLATIGQSQAALVVKLGEEEDLLTLQANGHPVPGAAGVETWRRIDALLTDALSAAGAAVVVFDKYYGHDHRAETEVLAKAIAAASEQGTAVAIGGLHRPPPEMLTAAGAYVGAVHAVGSGFDGSITALLAGAQLLDGTDVPSMATLAWCLEREPPVRMGERSDRLDECLAEAAPADAHLKLLFAEDSEKLLRSSDVLAWPADSLAKRVKGKIVFVGHFDSGQDEVAAPGAAALEAGNGTIHGVQLLAAACNQLENRARWVHVPTWLAFLVYLMAGLVPMFLLRRCRTRVRLAASLGTLGAMALGGLLLPLSYPWASGLCTALLLAAAYLMGVRRLA